MLAVVAVVSLGSFFVESSADDVFAFFAFEKNAFWVWTDFFDATAWAGQINHLAYEGKTRILKYLKYYIT